MSQVCGFCGNSKLLRGLYPTRDLGGNPYLLVECPVCKAVSLSPRPGSKELERAYDESYYGERQAKFRFPGIEQTVRWFRSGRARRLLRFLEKDDEVLDIGCGNGGFLQALLRKKAIGANGIERPGKAAARTAKIPGIRLKVGNLEKGDFRPASLKAVTLFHVFEHLEDPSRVLDLIDEILSSSGILMMSFPNIDSWQARIFKGNWLHLDPPRHLFFLRPRDFEKMMERRNYRVLRRSFVSLEQNPFGLAQSLLNLVCRKRELLFESLKGNSRYTRESGKLNLFLQKLFFLAGFPLFTLETFISALLGKGATVEYILLRKNHR